MDRTTEFILGLIGGIFGILGGLIVLFLGSVDAAFSASGTSTITGLGWKALIHAGFGIFGAVLVRSHPKVGGVFMLISAFGGFTSVFRAYILPGILLLIAGLMGVLKKDKPLPQQPDA